MHVALSWDISADGERWKAINDALRAGLKGYSWVRPLSTFYIVKVGGESDRQAMLQKLEAIAKGTSEKVNIVITPVMPSGRYNGYLPREMWDKINQRTG